MGSVSRAFQFSLTQRGGWCATKRQDGVFGGCPPFPGLDPGSADQCCVASVHRTAWLYSEAHRLQSKDRRSGCATVKLAGLVVDPTLQGNAFSPGRLGKAKDAWTAMKTLVGTVYKVDAGQQVEALRRTEASGVVTFTAITTFTTSLTLPSPTETWPQLRRCWVSRTGAGPRCSPCRSSSTRGSGRPWCSMAGKRSTRITPSNRLMRLGRMAKMSRS